MLLVFLCSVKVSPIHGEQTAIPNITPLPVFKLYLMDDKNVSVAVIKQSNCTNKLTISVSNLNMHWIYGQMYFVIILGSRPPNAAERALLFAGYSFINASAHK